MVNRPFGIDEPLPNSFSEWPVDRFSPCFETFPIGVLVLGYQGKLLKLNELAASCFGHPREVLEGSSLADFVLPAEGRRTRFFLKRLYQQDPERVETVLTFVSCKRDSIPCILRLSKYRGEDRQSRYLGVLEKTDAQLIHRKLSKTAEQPLARLAQVSGVGFWQIDIDGKTEFINPAMCRMLEIEGTSELKGQTYHSYFSRRSLARIEHERRTRPLGVGSTYEVEIIGKLGRRSKMLISSAPLFSKKGKLSGYIATFTDITRRKRAERQLEESRQRLSTVLQNVPDFILTLNREGEILYINRTQEEHVAEDVLGSKAYDYIPDDRHGQFADILEKVFENAQAQSYEMPDTSGRWYDCRMEPICSREAVVSALIIATDVTQQRKLEERHRRLEQRLRVTQKLESLEVLAGGIAHDFNNLLLSIHGLSSLALMDVPHKMAVRGRIEKIKVIAKRASELTNHLLSYSGRTKLEFGLVDLAELVREMTELLQGTISKEARIELELEDRVPFLQGDATQLRQLTMNLITNASDALNGKRGTICLRLGRRHLSSDYLAMTYLADDLPPGEYIFLEVVDDGIGMNEDTKARIFDPFFTTKTQGRGLGLASVLGIVRAHSGTVRIESAPGKGTSFTVLFSLGASKNKHLS